MPITWNATERQPVEPHVRVDQAFAGSAFRLTADDEFSEEEVRLLESDQPLATANPQLLIAVDVDAVTAQAEFPVSQTYVAISIRDRQLNQFAMVDRWKLPLVPDHPVPLRDALSRLSCGPDLEFCLSLYAGPPEAPTQDRGQPYGHVLARKTFVVRAMRDLTHLPKAWRPPEDFVGQGLHEDTIFYVQWLVHDLDTPPSDAFLVWLNDRIRSQIKSLELGHSSGRLLASELAGMVLFEICATILTSDQQPTNPVGTIQVVANTLGELTSMSLRA